VSAPWVLATRSEDCLRPLAAALAERGVSVVAFPVLLEEAAASEAPLDLEAVAKGCSLVVFTSRRAPAALRRCAGRAWSTLVGLPAAAVGTATAEAARIEGYHPVVVGDGGGKALAALLERRLGPGSTVLHPCGREHREEMTQTLMAAGIRVVPLVVYAMAEAAPDTLPALPPEQPLAVLLTSPRAARAYLRAVGSRFAGVLHLALGASTAAAVADAGVPVRALASTRPEIVVEELCRIRS